MNNTPATAKHIAVKPASRWDTIDSVAIATAGVLFATTASSTHYSAAAVIPLLALPTFWFWRHERRRPAAERTDTRTLVQTYLLTGTVGMVLVMAVQGIFAVATAYLLFGSGADAYLVEVTRGEHDPEIELLRDERFITSRSWQHWVFMVVFAFVMAAGVEESLKYSAIALARRYRRVVRPHDTVKVAIAAALGFATVENLAFVRAAWQGNEHGPVFALTVFERLIVGIPGHAMTAVLIATNMVAMDVRKTPVSWWPAIRVPVLFHGGFDFSLFAISAYNGHVGWVHPREGPTVYVAVAMAVAYNLVLAMIVRRALQRHGIVLS